jgi:hypothetical protein
MSTKYREFTIQSSVLDLDHQDLKRRVVVIERAVTLK